MSSSRVGHLVAGQRGGQQSGENTDSGGAVPEQSNCNSVSLTDCSGTPAADTGAVRPLLADVSVTSTAASWPWSQVCGGNGVRRASTPVVSKDR